MLVPSKSWKIRGDATYYIQILKAPAWRSPEFLAEWSQNKKADFERLVQVLQDRDKKYIVFHLFQTCIGWSQLNYLGRTAPRFFLIPFLDWYDARYREIFEIILRERVMDLQWLPATLPNTSSGLGLVTEKILLGNQVFGMADLIYVIVCRAMAPLIDTLIPLLVGLFENRLDLRDLEIYVDIFFFFGRPNRRIRTSDLNKRI